MVVMSTSPERGADDWQLGATEEDSAAWQPYHESDDEEGSSSPKGDGGSSPELTKRDRRRLLSKPRWYKKISKNMSKSSRRLYHQLWPQFGLEAPEPYGTAVDLPGLLGRPGAKLVVEVGFGGGECLAELASRAARQGVDVVWLGVEWHRGSVVNGMKRLQQAGVSSVRVYGGDLFKFLQRGALAESSVDEVMVFFPDPWPKLRDEPRRILRGEVVELLSPLVKAGGYLHVATDVREYAAWVGAVMMGQTRDWEACDQPAERGSIVANLMPGEEPGCEAAGVADAPAEGEDEEEQEAEGGARLEAYGLLSERPAWRPVTAYERRGVEVLGHGIYDLCYRRRPHQGGGAEGGATDTPV